MAGPDMSEPKVRYCPSCGAPLESSDICAHCGTTFIKQDNANEFKGTILVVRGPKASRDIQALTRMAIEPGMVWAVDEKTEVFWL